MNRQVVAAQPEKTKQKKKTSTYHHGDLREALLFAAESVLADRGLTGFTLRECARRAEVSHAAPAHHFKDVTGLLTALAVEAFKRLNCELIAQQKKAGSDSRKTFQAIGEGYIAFAANNPQHFTLMFRNHLLDQNNDELKVQSQKAFKILSDSIAAFYQGTEPTKKTDPSVDLMIAWSVVHGFSQLYLDGQLEQNWSAESQKENLTQLAHQMTTRLLDLFPNEKAE